MIKLTIDYVNFKHTHTRNVMRRSCRIDEMVDWYLLGYSCKPDKNAES